MSIGEFRTIVAAFLLLWGGIGWLKWWSPRSTPLFHRIAGATLAFSFLLITMQVLGVMGLLKRDLIDGVSLVFAVVGLGLGFAIRMDQRAETPTSMNWRKECGRVPVLLAAGLLGASVFAWVVLGLVSPAAPVSDGPIYHLPIALAWWRTSTLGHLWTPFGELAAGYFPANGDLWMCWLFLQSGGESLAKVAQAPVLLLGAAALFGISQRFAASPKEDHGQAIQTSGASALLPLCAFGSAGLVQATLALPLVDLFFTAWLIVAAYMLLEAGGVDRRQRLLLMGIGGLAFGVAFGSKATGPLAAPFFFLGALIACKRDWRSLLIFSIATIATGGFWFIRIFIETGNPLYPLHLQVGGQTWLEGWYTAQTMRASSDYHIDPFSFDHLRRVMGPVASGPLWILWLSSILLGLSHIRRRPSLAIFAIGSAAWFAGIWFLVPYNTQQRFMLPSLAFGFMPLAVCRGLWTCVPAAVLLWSSFESNGHRLLTSWPSLAAGVATLVFAAACAGRRRFPVLFTILVFVLGTLWYADEQRRIGIADKPNWISFYPQTGFASQLLPAWLTLEKHAGEYAAVVAYAGTNLPYYLYGPSFHRRPIYVNINSPAEWLPHHHHFNQKRKGASSIASTSWPNWHREGGDFSTWLANLRSLGAEYLFIARENFHGRKDSPTGLAPFPIEYHWALEHPEIFERIGPPPAKDSEVWAMVFRMKKGEPPEVRAAPAAQP